MGESVQAAASEFMSDFAKEIKEKVVKPPEFLALVESARALCAPLLDEATRTGDPAACAAALRELAFIRPFRMVSPEALPTLPEVSWRACDEMRPAATHRPTRTPSSPNP